GVAAGAPHAARGCIDLFIRRDPRRPTRMQALDSGEAEAAARLGSRPHVSESGYSDPRLDTRPRAARTHYRVLRTLYGATVLRLELETGRTHQIRAHLRRVGTPLLGDPIYGPGCEHGRRIGGSVRGPREEIEAALRVAASLKRPALHASDLEFTHPRSGESLRFRAPLPDDLRTLVHRLGGIGPAPVGSASAGPAV
ncbi:MAG: pseudouridine synthase, partial [Candidatus Krumholzibacteriia bacterium]